ncbi:hypothetical protein BX600DRAFT_143435 [Xylariales sp. PMI_506]|nr:hypothetical protein BX600DRAFT_143435 [Xylariales sp. PMI_506]
MLGQREKENITRYICGRSGRRQGPSGLRGVGSDSPYDVRQLWRFQVMNIRLLSLTGGLPLAAGLTNSLGDLGRLGRAHPAESWRSSSSNTFLPSQMCLHVAKLCRTPACIVDRDPALNQLLSCVCLCTERLMSLANGHVARGGGRSQSRHLHDAKNRRALIGSKSTPTWGGGRFAFESIIGSQIVFSLPSTRYHPPALHSALQVSIGPIQRAERSSNR